MAALQPSGPGGDRSRHLIVGVLAICSLLYFLNLGNIAFMGKDEPKNAQAAREMAERGDWVLTSLADRPWYDKPILYYWTARVGYLMFGPGELGARLGPALAGLFTIWLTWRLGRRVLGSDADGALAALALGTGLEFFWLSRSAVSDSLLTAAISTAIVAYLLAREGVREAPMMYLAYAATAVATLAKGPVGLVLPVLIVGADRLLSRGRGPRLRLRSGTLVFLAVALPWYYLAMARSGGRFFRDFILHFNLARFATDNLPHQGPAYYYIPILLLGLFPWSVFLPAALLRIGRTWRHLPAPERDRLRLLLLWIGMPLLFFSAAGSKLPSYLLPTFPALAVLLAREIRELLRQRGPAFPRPFTVAILVFAAAGASIAGGAVYYARREDASLLPAVIPLILVLAVTAIAAIWAAGQRRRHLALGALAAAAVLAPLTVIGWLLEPMERYASAKEVALEAMALEPGMGQLLTFRMYDNSFFFYADSRVERWWSAEHIVGRLDQVGTALCFARDEDVPQLKAERRMTVEPLKTVGHIELLRVTRNPPPPSLPEIPPVGPRTPTSPVDLRLLAPEIFRRAPDPPAAAPASALRNAGADTPAAPRP